MFWGANDAMLMAKDGFVSPTEYRRGARAWLFRHHDGVGYGSERSVPRRRLNAPSLWIAQRSTASGGPAALPECNAASAAPRTAIHGSPGR
jgi:hypothetical protein